MATQAKKESPDLSAIHLLGTMCSDHNRTLALQADEALYRKIIIPLCDDFTSVSTHTCNLILATLIQQAANHNAPETRNTLNKAGLPSKQHLLARLQRIQSNTGLPHPQQLKKICILSRVSIGADISITSVLIQRLHQHFPDVPIITIGPDHVPQLFCQPFLSHRLFAYDRNQSNYSRLTQWVQLQHIIDQERRHLHDDEFLLIDPDTRLSQLGLLPLAPEQSTRILPSRIDQDNLDSLSTIANNWFDGMTQTKEYAYPAFQTCRTPQLAVNTAATIVVNFGVGNDPGKRISRQFEQELILALIQQGNSTIILDSGKGPNETHESAAIESFIKEHPILTAYPHNFVRLQNSISTLTNHIQSADLFIGYDSCSGHIATAAETPTIICFKGAPNPRFFARWQPENHSGKTSCLKVPQKQLNDNERSLLIHHIIDIASSHYQTFKQSGQDTSPTP